MTNYEAEVQTYCAFTIELYRVTEKYKQDPAIEKLWESLKAYDAARRDLMAERKNQGDAR